jgi:peptidyl-prolyl cis-trans isomerase SurA
MWSRIAVFLCTAMFAVSAHADKTLVDRVVAVVEDDAIFQTDVEQFVKQMLLQRGTTSISDEERAELEKQAVQELIGNKLVIAQAQRLGINVSYSDVEQAVERAIEENKRTLGGEAGFDRQLEAEGMTLDELKQLYREQIRNRMLVDRVIAGEIKRESRELSERELREAYESRKAGLPLRPAVVHLATIMIAFESSENARSVAKAKIDDLHRRVLAGGDFEALARKHSEDPSAEGGGNLGFVKLEDLRERPFAEAAASLSTGEISAPVLTTYGYHLIQRVGQRKDGDEVQLRHILIRVNPDDTDIKDVFRRAGSIRERLLAGEPFDSVAVRYSDDPGSASNGGDLGWLRLEDLPDFFRDVLVNMNEGDISPVLRESTGFRIVRLLGRQESRTYTFDEVRDQLKQVLEQEKMGGVLQDYVDGLRNQFYVDVRE